MKKITKAIFPVAGLGTRFLPATKASPKEMLPVVDKPLIQYAAEEAIKSGITDLIFITGRNKRSIEDHFDKAYELENELQLKNKLKMLEDLKNIVPSNVNCIYIRQPEALGLGHAIMCAKPVIGDEPFAIILADELIDAEPNALQQMLEIYKQTGKSVLGLNEVSKELISSYGVVKLSAQTSRLDSINSTHPLTIEDIVEKPKMENAPSNLAVIGRYILTPQIFKYLAKLKAGIGHEIQLTDAIKDLLSEEQIYAALINGKRYDCGSKLGYLKATVGYALKHKELSEEFAQYLKSLV